MREYIIKQLRERVCVRGKQKTWISELSDDQLYQLFQRLRNGESAKSIARSIQKAWNVNPESSVHSLSQGILKFKRRIGHLLLSPPPENAAPHPSSAIETAEQLEGIEGLQKIYKGQLNRIYEMMQEEVETGAKFPHLNRDIQALSTLSKAIVKGKEYELLYGHVDPVKRRQAERLKERLDRGILALIDQLGPEGRSKLIAANIKLLENIEKRGLVDMEVGEDGNYRITDPKTGEVINTWKKGERD